MTAKKALTLSIVIPVYNEQDQIKGCLDAIKNQTIAPQEVIVVDNNSNDNSIAIAKKYAFVRIITAKIKALYLHVTKVLRPQNAISSVA